MQTNRPPYLTWSINPKNIPIDTKKLAILDLLHSLHISSLDLAAEVLGNRSEYKAWQDGLLRGQSLERFLNVIEGNRKAGEKLRGWMRLRAENMVVEAVRDGMDESKICMNMTMSQVTPEFLEGFDLERDVTEPLIEANPLLHRVLLAGTQSTRGLKENTKKDTKPITTVLHSQITKLHSSHNQKCAIPMGFFYFSVGTPRKTLEMLSHSGLSPSYDSIFRAHEILGNGFIRRAQIAARGPHLVGWDNTNIKTSIYVEQRDFAPPKVQSGTTSIIYPLRNASSPSVMELQPILINKSKLDLITFNSEIRPSRSQMRNIRASLVIDIVQILLVNYTDEFKYIKKDPQLQNRPIRPPPPKYKTQELVLRTTIIEEGSTEGNIKVFENIYIDQLDFKDSGRERNNQAILSINDQSTNARIRAAQELRVDDSPSHLLSLSPLQLGPGLFHVLLNLLWDILKVHRGTVNDRGSLQHLIAVLEKVRLGKEHPDYHTLRSFTSQVLSGFILLFWATEIGQSIEDFAALKPSADDLLRTAEDILDKYTNPSAAGTDQVRRNNALLVRDLLYFFDLNAAISSGDFGRVDILLGTLTMMFAGAGSTNYTGELLHFIQNLKKNWTPEFANVVRDNMLINTSGHDNHYHGVDYNCEKNIKHQKAYHKAKGANASWESLSNLAPCIPLYRRLKTQLAPSLGLRHSGTRHTPANTSSLVDRVTAKARELEIEKTITNRQTESGFQAVDILKFGGELTRGKSMKSFHKRYTKWAKATLPISLATCSEDDMQESDEDE